MTEKQIREIKDKIKKINNPEEIKNFLAYFYFEISQLSKKYQPSGWGRSFKSKKDILEIEYSWDNNNSLKLIFNWNTKLNKLDCQLVKLSYKSNQQKLTPSQISEWILNAIEGALKKYKQKKNFVLEFEID